MHNEQEAAAHRITVPTVKENHIVQYCSAQSKLLLHFQFNLQ